MGLRLTDATPSRQVSYVWSHFDKDANSGICKLCSRKIKCNGGTTSGLKYHLRYVHKLEMQSSATIAVSTNNSSKSSTFKDIRDVICNLAIDGIAIRTISNNLIINDYCQLRGLKMPKNPTRVMKILYEKEEVLFYFKRELLEMKK